MGLLIFSGPMGRSSQRFHDTGQVIFKRMTEEKNYVINLQALYIINNTGYQFYLLRTKIYIYI